MFKVYSNDKYIPLKYKRYMRHPKLFFKSFVLGDNFLESDDVRQFIWELEKSELISKNLIKTKTNEIISINDLCTGGITMINHMFLCTQTSEEFRNRYMQNFNYCGENVIKILFEYDYMKKYDTLPIYRTLKEKEISLRENNYINLRDLKKMFRENLNFFKSNNIIITGDSGTGKSQLLEKISFDFNNSAIFSKQLLEPKYLYRLSNDIKLVCIDECDVDYDDILEIKQWLIGDDRLHIISTQSILPIKSENYIIKEDRLYLVNLREVI